ncbi:MAG: SagB/ThcOx family dehydrogenase [Clostridiales bacterium]|jgi:SagB-type dehydrogenase family enzyme|nr:SagB/ThcOx family dehydrogenase [Clostridiales bacterium]
MSIEFNRNFMKCPSFKDEMAKSDQQNGVAPPPVNIAPRGGEKIVLPAFDGIAINDSYTKLLDIRRSVRVYDGKKPMTAAQLAYMCHTAMAIQEFRGMENYATLRPAPSGGARHPFELYVAVQNVEGLTPGLYHYLPLENVGKKAVTLERLGDIENFKTTVVEMVAGQKWAENASVTFFITCVAYRAEWRYRENAHRVVLIDLGHVGQNMMLSAAALGLGSCCIAAYNQAACDRVLMLDGTDEYMVYGVTVGWAKEKDPDAAAGNHHSKT